MGADPRAARGRGARRLGALLGGTGILFTGCAAMPDRGDVQAVKASPRADAQVRVHPVAPRKGAGPQEIINGFLEAMTSDDADYATARAYLSPKTSRDWRPQDRTTVLAVAPTPRPQPQRDTWDRQGVDFPMTGTRIAEVDDQQAYQALTPDDYRFTIHVSRQDGDGEWRIDALPHGLVLGQSDFQRNYRSVNKYYFASGQNKVVADPVFIRQRMDPVTKMDPVTQSVKALLDGPTNWLAPVVESPFPTGTALAKGVTALTTDDRDVLEVPLNEKASNAGRSQCRKMAAQIMFTLKDLSAVRVEQIELQRSDGSQLCTLSSGQEREYAADQETAGRPARQYFLNEKKQLAGLTGDGKDAVAEPVPGPLGTGQIPMGAVAVSRDERRGAAVTADGARLHIASIVTSGDPVPPTLASQGKTPKDRLTAPSWDGSGDLWIADRDPAKPALLRLADGAEVPVEVPIEPDPDGARIESLKVSADGARIALLLEKDGKTALHIGRVERTGSRDDPDGVSVTGLRPAAPQMEAVTAFSWAGPSRLVVVGREAGGVQQLRYLHTDGYTSAASVLPGLNQVRSISASNDDGHPLVAHSQEEGIVQLPAGATWQTVVPKGSSPVYPG